MSKKKEFKSWSSYSAFEGLVRRKTRYVFSPELVDFIDTMISTGKKRSIDLPKGYILFRSQRGCTTRPGYNENGDHEYDEDWPYDKKRMFPIKGKSTEGRANPRGISYLYLSDDRDTACAEVRPWKGSTLSLGLFETKKKLKIINCTDIGKSISFYFKEPGPKIRENRVWTDINNAFSRTNKSE